MRFFSVISGALLLSLSFVAASDNDILPKVDDTASVNIYNSHPFTIGSLSTFIIFVAMHGSNVKYAEDNLILSGSVVFAGIVSYFIATKPQLFNSGLLSSLFTDYRIPVYLTLYTATHLFSHHSPGYVMDAISDNAFYLSLIGISVFGGENLWARMTWSSLFAAAFLGIFMWAINLLPAGILVAVFGDALTFPADSQIVRGFASIIIIIIKMASSSIVYFAVAPEKDKSLWIRYTPLCMFDSSRMITLMNTWTGYIGVLSIFAIINVIISCIKFNDDLALSESEKKSVNNELQKTPKSVFSLHLLKIFFIYASGSWMFNSDFFHNVFLSKGGDGNQNEHRAYISEILTAFPLMYATIKAVFDGMDTIQSEAHVDTSADSLNRHSIFRYVKHHFKSPSGISTPQEIAFAFSGVASIVFICGLAMKIMVAWDNLQLGLINYAGLFLSNLFYCWLL